jgi:hypothetical protein
LYYYEAQSLPLSVGTVELFYPSERMLNACGYLFLIATLVIIRYWIKNYVLRQKNTYVGITVDLFGK